MKASITCWILLLCLAASMVGTACTDPPPPSLNSKDRQLIDSLYRLRADTLRPLLDSLCEAHFEERVQRAVDSMFELRVEEMERLIKRIQQQ